MTRVLIVDQFVGPSPYNVQRDVWDFDSLVAHAQRQPTWRAEVRQVDTSTLKRYHLPYCTTAYVAGEKNIATFLIGNWDSSG